MGREVKELMKRWLPESSMRRFGEVYTDTSEFMKISYGDVILVGGLHYLVLRDEAERKFGIEDPKFWVKRCRLLEGNEPRILKLVFHESFTQQLGEFRIKSYRSEAKEARILDLVRGDERFMQGVTHKDDKGNLVRVLEVIRGKRLDLVINALPMDHRTYFHDHLPEILEKYLDCCDALRFLHRHGEQHGDVRCDHIWVESSTARYRWIDFDYGYDFRQNPWGLDMFGLGNILMQVVGKGLVTVQGLPEMGFSGETLSTLEPGDFSLIFKNRLVNMRKLYPYIPEALNQVLMHFSASADVFYESVDELMTDLAPCLKGMRSN